MNTGHNVVFTILLTLAGIAITAGINLLGVTAMGRVQLWTSIVKFVPLLFISAAGLLFIDPANFATWNLSGQSTIAAIGGAMALCLFSYTGVESASVGAARFATRRVTSRGQRFSARLPRPWSTYSPW